MQPNKATNIFHRDILVGQDLFKQPYANPISVCIICGSRSPNVFKANYTNIFSNVINLCHVKEDCSLGQELMRLQKAQRAPLKAWTPTLIQDITRPFSFLPSIGFTQAFSLLGRDSYIIQQPNWRSLQVFSSRHLVILLNQYPLLFSLGASLGLNTW